MPISDFDGAVFWPGIKQFVIDAGIEPISVGEPEDEIWRKIFAADAATGRTLSQGMDSGALMRAAYALALGTGGGLPFGPFQTYSPGGAYSLWTGMFGVYQTPPLVNYDLTAIVYPASFPDRTKIAWNIHEPPPVPSRINGFPHVAHGNYYDDPAVLPGGSRQVYTITALEYTTSWSFTGDVATGLLLDCWLTTAPHNNGAFTDEVCAVGALTKLSTSAITYVAGLPTVGGGSFVDANGVTWAAKEGVAEASTKSVPNYIFYRPGNLDHKGKFDYAGVFAFLIAAGKISGNEYFNGAAFGPEPNTGAGDVTFDDFECTALASAARVPWTITNLTAAAQSATTVLLAYRAAAGATSHEYRINGAGSWLTVPGNKIITGLMASTSYSFEVRGVNGTGSGAASNSASATTTSGATEYVQNGTIDGSGVNWSGGGYGGMSLSTGKLVWSNTVAYDGFTQSIPSLSAIAGKYVELTYTVGDWAAGSVRAYLGGGTTRNGTQRSANGVYTERLLVNTGNVSLAFQSLTDTPNVNTLSVDTVSMRGPYNTATVGGA